MSTTFKTTVKLAVSRWFFLLFLISVAFASISISLLIHWINHSPVNVDGILYLEAAKIYAKHGFHALLTIYPWPFYIILLSTLSQWFHSDPLNTAFWITNIFITVTIIFSLAILREFRVSRTILMWSAALLLIYPSLDHLREYVIRGPGYWAFTMAGFWCLFRYIYSPRWYYAVLYSLSLFIATLFRMEGFVLWIAAPFIFFFLPDLTWRQKTRYFFQLEILFGMVGFVLFFWKISHATHYFSQLEEIYSFQQYLIQQDNIFTLNLPSSLTGNFFFVFLETLTPVYLFLVIYGWFKNRFDPSPQRSLFFWILIIQLGVALIFYLRMGVITDRYLLPFCLTLSLAAPLAFSHLSKLPYRVIAVLLVITAIDGIFPFEYSRTYLIDAGTWLKRHSQPFDTLYSNSREVLFYAEKSTIDWQINASPAKISNPLKDNSWKTYNYLAINLNGNDDKTLQQLEYRLSLQPIKIFRNKRDDKVVIFYVPH